MKHKFSVSLTLALILAMLVTSLALADNVVNDVAAGYSSTFTVGDSTIVDYWIVANNGDGYNGCNPGDGSAATVTINTPSGISASPGSLVFTTCGTNATQAVTFSSNTAGDYDITVSVSDSGTGSYNTNPGKITLHVLEPSTPADETAPTASPTQDPAANVNGWNNTDVTVYWNWADEAGGSGIDTTNCTTSSTSSGEGEITLTATCKDLAGNEGSASYAVKVDKTAPLLAPSLSPNPVLLNGSATASPNATDAISGVASSSCDPVDTSSVGSHSVNCTATDNAGNTTSMSASYTVNYALCVLYDQNKSHKAGSTVPLKLQLCDVNGVNYSSASIVVSATGRSKLDNSSSGLTEDSGNANPDYNFRYDATLGDKGGYIYNMSTKGLTSGTWKVMFAVDGVSASTYFVQFDVK